MDKNLITAITTKSMVDTMDMLYPKPKKPRKKNSGIKTCKRRPAGKGRNGKNFGKQKQKRRR